MNYQVSMKIPFQGLRKTSMTNTKVVLCGLASTTVWVLLDELLKLSGPGNWPKKLTLLIKLLPSGLLDRLTNFLLRLMRICIS
jgi:hypothetical protein